jgi:hypothetical protein
MKRKHRLLLLLLLSLFFVSMTVSANASVMAGLLSRVATRTGPGTQYDEPGTYFQNDWRTAQVEVINAAWDNYNDIWWVQLDFYASGKKFRAYTGLKRVAVDVNILPVEYPLGTTTMRSAAKAYWGPGRDYVESKYNVPNYTAVTVYGAENGFVQVEFSDYRTATSDRSLRRAWVTAVAVNGQWETPQFSSTTDSFQKVFRFCPRCGRELAQGNAYVFCPYCGSKLE